MDFIVWDEKYSVSHKIIDTQHKHLFSLIAQLNTANKIGRSKDILIKFLEELTAYAITHFREEEAYIEMHSLPGLRQQKREHQDFMKKIADFKRDYSLNETALVSNVLEYLKKWLTEHILNIDMQMKIK